MASFLLWSLLAVLACLSPSVHSSCTFPTDLQGTFIASDPSSLTFTSSTFGPFTYVGGSTTYSNQYMQCYSNSGNYYVTRSPSSFQLHSYYFYAYTCLEIVSINSNKWYYYYATAKNVDAGGYRVRVIEQSVTITDYSTVCNEAWPTGTYNMMIRNNTMPSEKQDCPTDLQGYFTYAYNNGSSTYCSSNSGLDTCTDKALMSVDKAKCNATVFYAYNAGVYCVYSSTSGSTHYVTLYNSGDSSVDGSTTFRYTCLMYTLSGTTGHATQYPGACMNTSQQTTTSVASPGGTYTFTLSSSCPASAGVNAGAVAGGVIGALLFIAIIVVVSFFLYKYLTKKSGTAPESDLPAKGKMDLPSSAKNPPNSRMVFSPANNKTINGDQSRAPTAVPDPEAGLTHGETDDSLPVYSEANDTPEPTAVTPHRDDDDYDDENGVYTDEQDDEDYDDDDATDYVTEDQTDDYYDDEEQTGDTQDYTD